MLLIAFFALIALTFSQPPALTLEIPFPLLPLPNITLPSLVGKNILVTGCRGIALEIVNQAYALGANVACTTRNRHTFNYATVPSTVEVWKLDYRKSNSPTKLINKFVMEYGRRPDAVFDLALEVINGDTNDYTEDLMDDSWGMYVKGSLLLEQAILALGDSEVPLIISYGLSAASKAMLPVFQEFYNMGKIFKEQHIKGQNMQKKYPNVQYKGVMCTFTNTTISITSYNPSAVKGDIVQQQFQAVIVSAGLALGVPPATVALAHLQAAYGGVYGNETIFNVLPIAGSIYSNPFYLQTFASGYVYEVNGTVLFMTRFGLDVTVH